MVVHHKGQSKHSRRKFGQRGGMYSRHALRKQKFEMIRKEEKSKLYMKDKMNCVPYQLIRKQVIQKGRFYTKFVVRRIPLVKLGKTRLISLGGSNLKFKLQTDIVSGYRIVNLDLLKGHVVDITSHVCLCVQAQHLARNGREPVILRSEMFQSGLFSIIVARCQGCLKEFNVSNSSKQENGYYDINVRAVWGTVTSGKGPAQLNEFLSTMDMPQIHGNMFSTIEHEIGKWWEQIMKEEMSMAGAEEKRLAIERNDFHQGMPAITVVCDGGWSKRTHKHTYNALGGVGVIFGLETKKLLYIGVRNKQCVICENAEKKKCQPKSHECFRNWFHSSQAMESDIILNGFLEAESVHGLRYMRVIADGDSSTYKKIYENVPIWGGDVQKLECANHSCKCIRANIERLVQEKPHYKGKGKLTGKNIVRLTTSLRCAIRMRSKQKNPKQLKHDIKNSIYHVLGFHDNCSDFCNKRISNVNCTDYDNDPHNFDDTDTIDTLFAQQSDFWSIPCEEAMEESRKAAKSQVPISNIQDIIRDVSVYLNRLAENSQRLIGNFTTNLAESWMSIRSKFDGGKTINRCSRGSWATRCYGGALRKNLGPAWSPIAFQKATGCQPGALFCKDARNRTLKRKQCEKYRATDNAKTVRRKRKLQCLKDSSNKKAKLDYGNPLDDRPDINESKLNEICQTFYKKTVQKTSDEITSIQENTIHQNQSELWKKERHHRLTSSNFGKIMSRKPTNVSSALIKTMLYSNFRGNINTIRGLAQEEVTVIEYKNKKGDVAVHKTGLAICKQHPHLAASPDGIVKENSGEGLLEIKNFLQNNKYLIEEAVTKVNNFCIEKVNNNLRLKRKHEIFYQIQGQLNIMDKEWCDFVLRRTNPYDMFLERIYIDRNMWEKMVPKLNAFYFKFLLPELACPRYRTFSGIRQPNSPWYTESIALNVKVTKKAAAPEPVPSTSTLQVHPLQEKEGSLRRSNRVRKPTARKSCKTVFVGKRIRHEWVIDESTNEKMWYCGTVIRTIKGKDGSPTAKYEVKYDGEESAYELDNLHDDFQDGCLEILANDDIIIQHKQ